ncbi:MAG TPA: NAD(P)H-hydrate dehydratase [Verrucomicrobiae bacterium]|nr:NAD(P)H-hydrate dehydratase [Verrucomicrobiae bacterium]
MKAPRAVDVSAALLRRWRLPQPDDGAGKDGRGRVLIVAGSVATPGSALLAVDAALRAGAGRVTLATEKGIALALAIAAPEARVIAITELRAGEFDADCVLIGPGMRESPALVRRVLREGADTKLILDACAMNVLLRRTRGLAGQVLITPHPGELAHLKLGLRPAIEREPERYAARAAQRWGVTVALKNATTIIVGVDGRRWRHRGGNPGLGVSGSGDVLAGIIAGLAARGASLEQAAAWGVALHARAGDALARRVGPLGYFARELGAEVPRLMRRAGN